MRLVVSVRAHPGTRIDASVAHAHTAAVWQSDAFSRRERQVADRLVLVRIAAHARELGEAVEELPAELQAGVGRLEVVVISDFNAYEVAQRVCPLGELCPGRVAKLFRVVGETRLGASMQCTIRDEDVSEAPRHVCVSVRLCVCGTGESVARTRAPRSIHLCATFLPVFSVCA